MTQLDWLVKPLGFETYNDYLMADHWQQFCRQVRQPRCFCCDRKNRKTHIHHITYKRIGKELPDDVITVCEDCHALIHASIKEKKTRLIEGHIYIKCLLGGTTPPPKPKISSKQPTKTKKPKTPEQKAARKEKLARRQQTRDARRTREANDPKILKSVIDLLAMGIWHPAIPKDYMPKLGCPKLSDFCKFLRRSLKRKKRKVKKRRR